MEALNPGSKRPKQVRHREWSHEVKIEICRLRTEHPNLDKEKIHIFLKRFCEQRRLSCPKPRTIGRLIVADAQDKMRTFPVKVRHNGKIVPKQRTKRLRKPKHFKADHPGHCISFDTVELIVHCSRKYAITFTDVYSHFSFAFATTSHASQVADFFKVVRVLFPYQIQNILTDNGSESMKHFDAELRRLRLTHWHTYPKTPKMNAHCERFNRTIQEEYINYHKGEMIDLHRFNLNMFDWLVWYNAERPHWSLNLQSPIQFLTK